MPLARQLNRHAVRRQFGSAVGCAFVSAHLVPDLLSHIIHQIIAAVAIEFFRQLHIRTMRPILFVSERLYAKRNVTLTTVSIKMLVLTWVCHGLKLAIDFAILERCIILQLNKQQCFES